MADNSSAFYRGKAKKKARGAFLTTVIVLTVIAFAALLFYGLQKFIVITNDGLYLDIPLLSDGSHTAESDEDIEQKSFEPVSAELMIGEPDYENVKATAGEGLQAVKAMLVPADKVSEEGIAAYAESVGAGNMLMLDVKPASGELVWSSQTQIALGYGTAGTVDLKPIIAALHEQKIAVGVRLCCFVDDTLASRYAQTRLYKTGGEAFEDDNGSWLDPSNTVVRGYIADLCRELDGMGVDEILLTAVRLPETEESFAFTANTSATPTPETVISGFGLNLARKLKSGSAALSVQINTDAAMQGVDAKTGQSAKLLLKVFDRIYKTSDKENAAAVVSSSAKLVSLGKPEYRIVPICYDAAPGTSSWLRIG